MEAMEAMAATIALIKMRNLILIIGIVLIIFAIAGIFLISSGKKELTEQEFEEQNKPVLEALYAKYSDSKEISIKDNKESFMKGHALTEISFIAVNENNPALCNALAFSKYRKHCSQNFELYYKYKPNLPNLNNNAAKFSFGHWSLTNEITAIAVKERNIEICDNVEDETLQQVCKDNFYLHSAIQKNNPELCYNVAGIQIQEDPIFLNTVERKITCLSIFNKDSCSSIQDEKEKNACNFFIENKDAILSKNYPCSKAFGIDKFSRENCEMFSFAVK